MKKTLVILAAVSMFASVASAISMIPTASMTDFGTQVAEKAISPILQGEGVTGAPVMQAIIEPVVRGMLAGYTNSDNTINFQELANGLKGLTPEEIKANLGDAVITNVSSKGVSDSATLVETVLTDTVLNTIKDSLVARAEEYLKVDRENVTVTAGGMIKKALDSGETDYDTILADTFAGLRKAYTADEVSDQVLNDTIAMAIRALTLPATQITALNSANE